ncbi:ABC-F family ATP-binding cassette domain-containing protein [Nakamurella lactea]|uniref:ABC-F family ATP-binding cassette domain-containing protein n=1 Tax=Nakamurella lactea TaxID=459515 RepID=UPI00042A4164|nr:ABC-F family ATP-binding cassette domain-containing protein [Nakamurella lactea]
MSTAITLSAVQFAWPDGEVVFDDLSAQIPSGTTGLVGTNGSGKSTLLRLVAGVVALQGGSIAIEGRLGYLPQDLVLQADRRVDEHLGIAAVRHAIAAIEAGDTDARHFETIGDDWDVESRTLAELARLGLPPDVLDRQLGALSGGECTRLALVALLLDRPDVLLLDEPTNNLDGDARRYLYDLVTGWSGTLVVVSHDRELLELVDRIAEIRPVGRPGSRRSLTWYGGNFSAYREAVQAQQAAAEQAVTAARSDVRRQRSDLVDAQVTLARRERYGRKMSANKREPKIIMNQRKRAAQESAAKFKGMHTERLEDAKERLDEAQERLRRDDVIRIDLPATEVPAGRDVLQLTELRLRTGQQLDLTVRGPERIAVTGPNGSGKTTLLHTIAGRLPPVDGQAAVRVPARLLPQRIDLLDPALSVFQNAAAFAPTAEPNPLRARLARFLFSGDAADRPVAALSGGEQFRAALACLLLAEPAPQLLILDEPTNNLDLASVEQLTSALAAYRGALLVASHDEPFLEDIAVSRRIELSSGPETPDTPPADRSAP